MERAKEVSIILHDVRSSHNVGSIFRTSDAIGVSNVYLTGYTPLPVDKFGRVNKEIAKVALGAEQTIEWTHEESVLSAIKKLKAEKYLVVAVEQDERSIDYKDFVLDRKTAFIFGNEVEGLSKEIISMCDGAVSIPMKGKKESLNVSVAFGIALARITNL